MSAITWKPIRVRLRDLEPWERNPRKMSKRAAEKLIEGWRELGQAETIAVGPNGEVYNGHQRLSVLSAAFGYDFDVWALQSSRPLTEAERERLVLLLHAGATGGWDWDALANWDAETLMDGGIDEALRDVLKTDLKAIDELLASTDADEDDFSALLDADDSVVERASDIVYPSSNEFGIPDLRPDMQATEFEAPFLIWGAQARRMKAATIAFYTDDYRFERLWREPGGIFSAQPVAVVEPNFSCYAEMPRAVCLWNIYRKRWLARWWQERGLLVWVDLNVNPRHYRDALLGVPRGWKAYASRGNSSMLDALDKEHAMAAEHAGGEPLFLVYGGGSAVERRCVERGWLYVGEVMSQKGDNDG